MKFDFPEPFGPIRTVIEPNSSFSMDRMLLKPLTLMKSSSGMQAFSSSYRDKSNMLTIPTTERLRRECFTRMMEGHCYFPAIGVNIALVAPALLSQLESVACKRAHQFTRR